MIDCVSVQNMRLSDHQTIERGTSGKELICRAAFGVYQAVQWNGKIAIFTGSGNNGADGFALAEILHSEGNNVTVFKVSERMHEDCAYFAMKAINKGVPVLQYNYDINVLHAYDMIVDCMLGTGFCGEIRDAYRHAVEKINDSGAYVISVDINSGMNGDTGEGSAVVCSDLTVTIEFVKNGMVSESAGKHMKRVVCTKIGIELAERENMICNEWEWTELCALLQVSTDKTCVEYEGCYYLKCPPWIEIDS